MDHSKMSYITLIVYPILILILFWKSKVIKKSEYNEEWNSVSETKAIQGLIALCIVCHHTAQQTCASWLESRNIVHGLDPFLNIGFMLVAVFFFWSGYGLYKSVTGKSRYLSRFLKKRVLPVWVPYVIVCFLYTLVRLLFLKEKMPIWFIITNLTGITIGYEFGWYVQAIIIFYILFYYSFKKTRFDSDAIMYIWIGVVIWNLLGIIIDHNDYFLRGEWWYNSTLLFPIGITFAKHEEKIFSMIKKWYRVLVPVSVVLLTALIILSRYTDTNMGYYGEYTGVTFETKIIWRVMTYLPQVLAAVMFVFVLILICMKIQFKNAVLDFLGSHTLEIYLTHGFFLQTMAVYYNYHRDSIFYGRPFLLLVFTVILTIPASAGLKRIGRLL